jgi:hypothetical protein
MDFGFDQFSKVNLLNLIGIDPAEQCRNLANPGAPPIRAAHRCKAGRGFGSERVDCSPHRGCDLATQPRFSTIATALGAVQPSAGFRPIRRPDRQSQFGSGLGLFPHCFGSYALMGGDQ